MRALLLAMGCAALFSGTAAAQVSVSVANGTMQIFDSITVFAVTPQGELLESSIGQHDLSLRPGQSVTIPLSLDFCQPVLVQAGFASTGTATISADACDPAIFTLTE